MNKFSIYFLATIFSHNIFAASSAEQFGVHKWPLEPILKINTDPDLCNALLAKSKTAFNSAANDLNFEKKFLEDNPALNWVPLKTHENNEARQTLFTLELDLDANGSKQVVLYRDIPFNWQGNWHYAYVFKNVASFNQVKSEIIKKWSDLSESYDQYSPENTFGAVGYFPSSKENDKYINAGDVWAEHQLFKFRNFYYFFQATSSYDRMQNSETNIYKLNGDGHLQKSCTVSLANEADQYKKFISSPAIASFISTIHTIGAGGIDSGTAHYALVHDNQAIYAEHRAAYRPWALDQANDGYYTFDNRMIAFLENWSFLSIWNKREYDTLLEQIPHATTNVANYLKSEFGLTDEAAKQKSKAVIEQLLAARILVPSGWNLSNDARSLYFPNNQITEIFLMKDKAKLDKFGNQKTIELNSSEKMSKDELISFAIEWPYGINSLLSSGANPNFPDEIAKTPIMLAAHMNRPDSMRTLLKAGANVNAKTKFETDFSQAAIVNDRTALMYAAENANPLVMKILLDAGADINAKDSKGNNISYYLSKNPRLSNDEKKLTIQELAIQAAQFSKPSFDCSKATTAIEKAICADEVLSMFDNELSRAYLIAKNRFGAPLAAEQKNWLIRRNTSCKDETILQECLADITRTRIRYLHNRIAE